MIWCVENMESERVVEGSRLIWRAKEMMSYLLHTIRLVADFVHFVL